MLGDDPEDVEIITGSFDPPGARFVDLVDGKANVRKYEHVAEGQIVETGAGGHAEIGLGWDSLLRLDENSSVVLSSLDKSNVSVRIESGSALLEVPDLDKPNRINISIGNIKALIDSAGVFHFADNSVLVTEGKAKINDGALTLQKGYQVINDGGKLRQSKVAA